MIEESLRSAVLGLVPEFVASVREELGRPRMLPIKEAPVAYRAILAAEKAGELQVYRVGHAALVDEVELFSWVRRVGLRQDKPTMETEPEKADEIGAIIEMGDERRKRRTA